MGRALLGAGALLGFLGVATGAFGAHAMRAKLTPERLDNWKTAADYQLWHALATIAAGLAAARWESGVAAAAGWCFVAGTLVFSGSLYALALSGVEGNRRCVPHPGRTLVAYELNHLLWPSGIGFVQLKLVDMLTWIVRAPIPWDRPCQHG